MATLFGSGIKRREDPRLITGSATYTDDVKLPGLTYAMFVRSPYAHAKVTSISIEAAKNAPGVVAVYTGRDVKDALVPVPCAWNPPGCDLKVPPHPLLAYDKVRYVGDAVAMIVAESRAAARDAVDLVEVEYDPLPATADPEKAAQPGAAQLHPEVPNNIAFTWVVNGGDAPVDIESITLSSGLPFALASDAVPLTLAPSAGVVLHLSYSPTALGAHRSEVVVRARDPLQAPLVIPLRGVAESPALTSSPAAEGAATAAGVGAAMWPTDPRLPAIGLSFSSVTMRRASFGPTPLARATAALSCRLTAAASSGGGSTSSTDRAALGPTPWIACSWTKAVRSSRVRKP